MEVTDDILDVEVGIGRGHKRDVDGGAGHIIQYFVKLWTLLQMAKGENGGHL